MKPHPRARQGGWGQGRGPRWPLTEFQHEAGRSRTNLGQRLPRRQLELSCTCVNQAGPCRRREAHELPTCPPGSSQQSQQMFPLHFSKPAAPTQRAACPEMQGAQGEGDAQRCCFLPQVEGALRPRAAAPRVQGSRQTSHFLQNPKGPRRRAQGGNPWRRCPSPHRGAPDHKIPLTLPVDKESTDVPEEASLEQDP